ncbi:MvdC family ATP-grasp ribosomal peptide maturase [Sorangium sp. So ce341]|uniref:MvdC family ATP-grasp ribosomal peptide maturase n=1 Tax=Sorangium sp. So ce341 TaxID=3133302 RepID=UPI003F61CA8C
MRERQPDVTTAGDNVLLVSHSQDDFGIERVAEALRRRGARPVRLNVDRFPRDIALSTALGAGGVRRRLEGAGAALGGDEISAVWLRRVWAPNLGEGVPEAYRAACVRESMAALTGWLRGLPARRWINEPAAEERAQDKLRQLAAAASTGLRIPETLVTNDPAEARAFFARLGGNVVAKMLTPFSTSLSGNTPFVFTHAVSAADLDALSGLRQSPMVFQERIPKARELRVACVGGRCFPGALDASRYESIAVDWRHPDVSAAGIAWERDALPRDVEAQLGALLRALGLAFGAVDLIRTPEGEHVFLEINPAGEWGMLERDLGLPIADALAEALLAPTENP